MEVDWDKTAIKYDFGRYDFTNEGVHGLEEESVQVWKHTPDIGDSSTTITLAAVPVFFWAYRKRANISNVQRDYDAYRGSTVDAPPASGVDLGILVDQDLSLTQSEDPVEVPWEEPECYWHIDRKRRLCRAGLLEELRGSDLTAGKVVEGWPSEVEVD